MAKKDNTENKKNVADTDKQDKPEQQNISGTANATDDIEATEQAVQNAQRLPMMIHTQYVRDISFENPNAPFSFLAGTGRPEIDVNFSMDARKMDIEKMGLKNGQVDNLYEVVLSTTIKAEKQGNPAFILEIEYGMAVSLNNIPEEQHHSLLLIEMPKYMFPYVRHLVAELSGQGGYAPLMLTPVNFSKFYMERFGKDAVPAQERAEERNSA